MVHAIGVCLVVGNKVRNWALLGSSGSFSDTSSKLIFPPSSIKWETFLQVTQGPFSTHHLHLRADELGSAATYQWASSIFTQGDACACEPVCTSACDPVQYGSNRIKHWLAGLHTAEPSISAGPGTPSATTTAIQPHAWHVTHSWLFLSQRMLSLLYPAGLLHIFAVWEHICEWKGEKWCQVFLMMVCV